MKKRKKKKQNKANIKGTQTRDTSKTNLAQSQEDAPRVLSQLLAASDTTKKSLYILAPSRPEDSS
jgi:hypothetical protein